MSSRVYYCFVVFPELTIFSPSHFANSQTVDSHSVHFHYFPCWYSVQMFHVAILCILFLKVFALTTVAEWLSKKPCDRRLQLPGVRLWLLKSKDSFTPLFLLWFCFIIIVNMAEILRQVGRFLSSDASVFSQPKCFQSHYEEVHRWWLGVSQ